MSTSDNGTETWMDGFEWAQAKGRGGKEEVPGRLKFSVRRWREEWRKEEILRRVKRKDLEESKLSQESETFTCVKISQRVSTTELETRDRFDDSTFIC